MSTRFAVVGPGRVGSALARRWREGGLEFVGFRGRGAAALERALEFVGAGRALERDEELAAATVVALAVGDDELAEVAARCARGAVGPGSLWLHVSGFHGLGVLDPAAGTGARIGSLHPLCPFPDAESGYRAMTGRPAVLEGDADVLPRLRELAEMAGMRPVPLGASVDRPTYHAACALAANGLTALFATVERLFVERAGVARDDARELCADLLGSALGVCRANGPRDALSGPVLRGDESVVRAHLESLARGAVGERAYRALMVGALELAEARDPGVDRRRLRALLEGRLDA